MEIKGINILEKELKKYKGADVMIDICHNLYGNQKVKCCLDYIFDKNRVGFKTGSQYEIFIYRADLVDYGIKDGIYFADNVMKIDIKLNKAV